MGQDITKSFFDCCDDWTFKLSFDQWWSMRARCAHESFFLSDSSLEHGLESLLAVARSYHSF